MNILFVCLGNICRSPMAEFIAKDIIKQHKIKDVHITSAGTSGYHDGQDMHIGTKTILNKYKIDYSHFASKKINDTLFNNSDYVIVMDNSNYDDVVNTYNNKDKIYKLSDYLPKEFDCIPDPWYTNNFELVYSLLTNGIKNFFKLNKIID